jgi:hypothetical protein
MKKILVTIAATGVLALAGVAGTAASASAATTHATTAATASPNFSRAYGPFASAQDCENFVRANGEWGVWDCEFLSGPYGGWYALVP